MKHSDFGKNLRAIYKTYVSFGLLMIFPMYFLFQNYNPQLEISYDFYLVWGVILYSSLRLISFLITGYKNIIDLTFWIFVYIWMGIIPLIQIYTDRFPLYGEYDSKVRIYSLLIVIIGLIFYDFGKGLSRNKNNNDHSKNESVLEPEWNRKALFIFSLISLLISMFMLLKIGGVSSLFVSRTDFNIALGDNKTGSLVISNLLRVPIYVSSLLFLLYFKRKFKSDLKSRIPFNSWGIMIIVINLLINNPINTARYWLGTIIISSLFIIIPWKKTTYTSLTVVFCLLFVVIFPNADVFRKTAELNNVMDLKKDSIFVSGDFDAFQMLMNTVKYVDNNSVAFGKQFLGGILFWIPRSIWTDKPIGSGQLVAENSGYVFTNLSSPLWAEGYINFGLLGVILLFFIYGYIIGKLQQSFIESNKITISCLVPFISAYQIFFLRGEFLVVISFMSSFVFYALVGSYFCSHKKKWPLRIISNKNADFTGFKTASYKEGGAINE
jgi:oligosaccharide repeat unit polymerase